MCAQLCYDARFMQTGIVGLPQVGKTTLFRILTRSHLEEKAARGATHIGVARVPEPRIDQLAALYKPRKVTYATVEYVDVGGIVRDRARAAHAMPRFHRRRTSTARARVHRRRTQNHDQFHVPFAAADALCVEPRRRRSR